MLFCDERTKEILAFLANGVIGCTQILHNEVNMFRRALFLKQILICFADCDR